MKNQKPNSILMNHDINHSAYVFLSFAPQQQTMGTALFVELTKRNHGVWITDSVEATSPADTLRLHRAVENSNCVVLCLSQETLLEGSTAHQEMQLVLDKNPNRLVVVTLEALELPETLAQYPTVDMLGWRDAMAQGKDAFAAWLQEAVDRLCTAIQATVKAGEKQHNLPLKERICASCIAMLGECHELTMLSQIRLANGLLHEQRHLDALALLKEVDVHIALTHSQNTFVAHKAMASKGKVLLALHRIKEAKECLEPVYNIWLQELGEDHSETLDVMRSLVFLNMCMFKPDPARELMQRIHEAYQRRSDIPYTQRIWILTAWTNALSAPEKQEQAAALLEEALQIGLRHETLSDASTLPVVKKLATVYCRQERYDEALKLLEDALASLRSDEKASEEEIVELLKEMAHVFTCQKRFEKALALHLQRVRRLTRMLGKSFPETLSALLDAAICCKEMAKLQDAERLLQHVVKESRRILGNTSMQTQRGMKALADVLTTFGRHEEALALRQEVLDGSRSFWGKNNRFTLHEQIEVAKSCTLVHRYTEGVELAQDAYDRCMEHYGKDAEITLWCAGELASIKQSKKKA